MKNLFKLLLLLPVLAACNQPDEPEVDNNGKVDDAVPEITDTVPGEPALVSIEGMGPGNSVSNEFYLFQEGDYVAGFRCLSNGEYLPKGRVAFSDTDTDASGRIAVPRRLYAWADDFFAPVAGDTVTTNFFWGYDGEKRAYSTHLVRLKQEEFLDWYLNELTDDERQAKAFGIPVSVRIDDAQVASNAREFWMDIEMNRHLIGFQQPNYSVIDVRLSESTDDEIIVSVPLDVPRFKHYRFPDNLVRLSTYSSVLELPKQEMAAELPYEYLGKGWSIYGNGPRSRMYLDFEAMRVVGNETFILVHLDRAEILRYFSADEIIAGRRVIPLEISLNRLGFDRFVDGDGNLITGDDLELCRQYVGVDEGRCTLFLRMVY